MIPYVFWKRYMIFANFGPQKGQLAFSGSKQFAGKFVEANYQLSINLWKNYFIHLNFRALQGRTDHSFLADNFFFLQNNLYPSQETKKRPYQPLSWNSSSGATPVNLNNALLSLNILNKSRYNVDLIFVVYTDRKIVHC